MMGGGNPCGVLGRGGQKRQSQVVGMEDHCDGKVGGCRRTCAGSSIGLLPGLGLRLHRTRAHIEGGFRDKWRGCRSNSHLWKGDARILCRDAGSAQEPIKDSLPALIAQLCGGFSELVGAEYPTNTIDSGVTRVKFFTCGNQAFADRCR